MKRIYIGKEKPNNKSDIEEISTLLHSGKVGVLPTATIYGLSCIYDDEAAVKKIYRIKKRKAGTPFIILISSISQIEKLATSIKGPELKLMNKYWNINNPSPLTLVLPRSGSVGEFVTGGRPTIAVRLAGLEIIRDIIESSGPIVSTSATLSGTAAQPRTLEEVPPEIREGADFAVDYGSSLGGSESTIVDLTGEAPTLLRQGAVDYDEILEDFGDY